LPLVGLVIIGRHVINSDKDLHLHLGLDNGLQLHFVHKNRQNKPYSKT
jgi:hypothetical protein